MPRTENRIREDSRRAEEASPRVGDVYERGQCTNCGYYLLVTLMRIYRYGGQRNEWLCRLCTQSYLRAGRLRVA